LQVAKDMERLTLIKKRREEQVSRPRAQDLPRESVLSPAFHGAAAKAY